MCVYWSIDSTILESEIIKRLANELRARVMWVWSKVINMALARVSSRIFCLGGGGGGKIVCNDQLCVKHEKFLTSHMPIFEYQSPMHEKA